MKKLQFTLLLTISLLITSCFGDKKRVNISEMSDTSSFVNKNFKGNLINYSKGMSACNKISAEEIAKLYGVSANKVKTVDPTKMKERFKKNLPPSCAFFLESGEKDYLWLRGGIGIQREVGKDEFMGEVAEAAGNGKDWKQAWALKKSISKSAEWLPNMGQAALWNPAKNQLDIKFDGYTLTVNPLKNILNKEDVAKKRDYKKIAIAMAKAAGYIE